MMFGGKDISKHFKPNGQPKHIVCLFLQIPSTTEFGMARGLFWWNDPLYEIGQITEQERQIKIIAAKKSMSQLPAYNRTQFVLSGDFFCSYLFQLFRFFFFFLQIRPVS